MMIYTDTLKNTQLWKFPRVSLEALFDAILQCHPREENKSFHSFNSLDDLQAFVKTIDEYELYFETEIQYAALTDNFQSLMSAILKAKPSAVKGAYLKSITLAPTMGPGVKVKVASVSE